MTASEKRAERTIQLSLICEAPPVSPGIEFGLQDKSGALTPGVSDPDGSLRFDAEIRAVTLDDGTVRLRGPIVHGPPSAPFLYLSCRAATDADSPWIFRLKVPLRGTESGATSVEGRIRASRGGTVALIGGCWTASAGR